MGYTPVKGGADAVRAAAELTRSSSAQLIADAPGERSTLDHVQAHLGAAVDRIMGEGGLFAPDLAAVAITQAEGDMDEAALLLRAYRSTLPRLGYTLPIQGRDMRVTRRISAAFKDIPGGQLLGRTRDYTHRLLVIAMDIRIVNQQQPNHILKPVSRGVVDEKSIIQIDIGTRAQCSYRALHIVRAHRVV
ncbi:MAG: hypothetical protein EBV53_03175 [Proteobacteria bacterium]|nr:hypothetical protein [Pseudomonadota bacterium]